MSELPVSRCAALLCSLIHRQLPSLSPASVLLRSCPFQISLRLLPEAAAMQMSSQVDHFCVLLGFKQMNTVSISLFGFFLSKKNILRFLYVLYCLYQITTSLCIPMVVTIQIVDFYLLKAECCEHSCLNLRAAACFMSRRSVLRRVAFTGQGSVGQLTRMIIPK